MTRADTASTDVWKQVAIHRHGDRKLLLRRGPGWDDADLARIVLPLLSESAPADASPVASSAYARAWKAPPGGPPGAVASPGALFIKLFLSRGLKDSLLFFRGSRSLRAMAGNEVLRRHGFHAPATIAQGDIRKGVRTISSFLITEWVEGVGVYPFLRTHPWPAPHAPALRARRDFIRAFGSLVGRLHQSGIFHGDLRGGNVLITQGNDAPRFILIDNERTRHFPGGIPMRLRLKNLVQTRVIVMPELTTTDRMRFLRAYLDHNPQLEPNVRKLLDQVHRLTQHKLGQKA
jgi:serine/threonine protein kinase